MCQVIAITNQKGGVGKTTTTFHLGTKLAQEGKRVLLIDADPQASLTVCFGIRDADTLDTTLTNALQAIVEDEPIDPRMGIRTHKEGAKLFPANIELASFETAMINGMSREYIMRELVSAHRPNFEYSQGVCAENSCKNVESVERRPGRSKGTGRVRRLILLIGQKIYGRCFHDSTEPWKERKVRAPSEKMPDNNRANNGNCSFLHSPVFDRKCNRKYTARNGKGEKAV